MTGMDIKEIALVEEIATLGKIHIDCRASADMLYKNGSFDNVNANAISVLNLSSRYAAEQILQKIRDYAADLNAEEAEDDNA